MCGIFPDEVVWILNENVSSKVVDTRSKLLAG